jgi:hypothetical protein
MGKRIAEILITKIMQNVSKEAAMGEIANINARWKKMKIM